MFNYFSLIFRFWYAKIEIIENIGKARIEEINLKKWVKRDQNRRGENKRRHSTLAKSKHRAHKRRNWIEIKEWNGTLNETATKLKFLRANLKSTKPF